VVDDTVMMAAGRDPVLLIVPDDDSVRDVLARRDPETQAILPVGENPGATHVDSMIAAMGGHEGISNRRKSRYRHVCVVATPEKQLPLVAFVAATAWPVIERADLFICESPYHPDRERPVSIEEAERALTRSTTTSASPTSGNDEWEG